MKIDRSEFLNEYTDEAQELINKFSDSVRQLSKVNTDSELIELILRTLHTLKGTSRMMGFSSIEKVVNALEDVYKKIQSGNIVPDDNLIYLCTGAANILGDCIAGIKKDSKEKVEKFEPLVKNLELASLGENFETDFFAGETDCSAQEDETDFSSVQTIRVGLGSVDSLVKCFDKIITNEFRLKNSVCKIEELSAAEQKYAQMFKTIKEDMNMLERQIFYTQEQIISMRMFPLDMIMRTLRHSAEEEAARIGKEIDFEIPSADISLDKLILEKLPGIIIHLVRNSIDHGIEPPQVREQLGKNKRGKISIEAKQVANRINIIVSDDGQGLDFDKIRKKATALFPSRIEEISSMDEKSLQQFLFVSGFSTLEKQTSLSGRGVGLDGVRKEMDKLKGRIRIFSERGKGTSFELSLPMSLAAQSGLFFTASSKKFLVFSHYVSEVVSCCESKLIQLRNGTFLPLRNELLPVYDSSIFFGKADTQNSRKKSRSIVVVEYLGKRLGLLVDEVTNYITVLVKPLPPALKKFRAVQGVVFDEDYKIVPIIHIPDLMSRLNAIKDFEVKKIEVDNRKKEYSVLIVDDSHTTRQIERMILETEGYAVCEASDGIEALEKLKSGSFDIVITDIKMPRMDGYILIENMRRLDATKNIPVIVISSVYEEDTKKRVTECGAQSYIVKSDFERGNLIMSVKELLNGI